MYLAAIDVVARGGSHGPRFIFPLLLVLSLVVFGGWFIRQRRGGSLAHRANGSPLQTLQERFARGEVDRAEFEHRKAVLLGDEVVPPSPERPPAQPSNPPAASEQATSADQAEDE